MSSRMTLAYSFCAVALPIVLAGCDDSSEPAVEKRRPLDRDLIEEYRLADGDLLGLQYYNDEEIVLERQLDSKPTKERQYTRLVSRSGRSREEVVIPRQTPGVCVRVGVGRRWFDISWQDGTSLRFVAAEGGGFRLEQPGHDGVEFAGNWYAVKGGSSTRLLVAQRSLDSSQSMKRTLAGRRADTNR
jgi:hypothetical protein